MRGMTVRRKILWLLTTGLEIAGVSAGAFAGAGKAGNDVGAALFARLDLDADGAVSRAEYDAGVMGRFARFDENSDGQVTQIEFDKPRQDWQALRARMRQMGRDFWSEPAKL
ncbi:MAG: hypothetical protein ACC634_07830 [Hyphomicrobiales bacterium]